MEELSHFAADGTSQMVDVSAKDVTLRSACASGLVRMRPATLTLILDRKLSKGDVFAVARLAGIMAAKRTGDLIPLCHPLGIDGVEVGFEAIGDATVRGRTGVEMEALTAATVAALTIYDMCKAVDREMVIDRVMLEAKSGGRSGDYRREGEAPGPA